MNNTVGITEMDLNLIPIYLKETKQLMIDMDLNLDKFEISKSLTISLNRKLIGNKTELIDIYNFIMDDFDISSKKINLIEDKIKNFNLDQTSLGYFVDPEKILYIVLLKQIIYIKELIVQVNNFIISNINLVYIYSYVISKLYNEPNNISSNYIFIINKMFSDTSVMSKYDNRLENFLNLEIIEKIFSMIKIIFSADYEFIKLLSDLENKKMEEYKKNNSVDYSESYKELEKNSKIIKGGNNNISEIENNFIKMRDFLFVQKRKIDIPILYNIENINLIFKDQISIELWFGYNLFLYKRFEYDFNEYQTKINGILKSKGYTQIYLLDLNYLNDINTPDAGILPIVGGGNIINKSIDYYSKYLKYKNKYLKLKKFEK